MCVIEEQQLDGSKRERYQECHRYTEHNFVSNFVQILLEQYLIKECKTVHIFTDTTDVKKLMSIL